MGGQHEHLKNNTNPHRKRFFVIIHLTVWGIGKKHMVTTNVKITNKRSALPWGGLVLSPPPIATTPALLPAPPVAPALENGKVVET